MPMKLKVDIFGGHARPEQGRTEQGARTGASTRSSSPTLVLVNYPLDVGKRAVRGAQGTIPTLTMEPSVRHLHECVGVRYAPAPASAESRGEIGSSEGVHDTRGLDPPDRLKDATGEMLITRAGVRHHHRTARALRLA
jgi:hypothetical protein